MRKSVFSLAFVFLLAMMTVLTACTASPSVVTQPPVTVTATQTTIATVTVTPLSSNIIPPPLPTSYNMTNPTPAVTPTQTNNPNNNAHFFVGRDISGYTKIVNPDGSITQSPVYKDLFLDLDLVGFFTDKDATFIPRVPGITDHDDWIVKITMPTIRLPFTLNWSYTMKDNKSKTSLKFSLWRFDDFKTYYNNNPIQLNTIGVAADKDISSEGVHYQQIREQTTYAALIRVSNPEDNAGWWIKVGGKLY
jgi:hypothetical protein